MVNSSNGTTDQSRSNATNNYKHSKMNNNESKSKTVESLIQPIINQLNFLSVSSSSSSFSSSNNNGNNGSSKASGQSDLNGGDKKKGRSRRAHTLVESLIEATENFLRQGSDLAHEYPEMKEDILNAIGLIRQSGNSMAEASREFANDPFSNQKRSIMIRASKELLTSIGKLLTIADLIDNDLLFRAIQMVQEDLLNLKNSTNQDELTHHFKSYGTHLIELTNLAGKKQSDLTDPKLRDEMASARSTLKKTTLKLLTTCKVHTHTQSISLINRHSLIYYTHKWTIKIFRKI